MSEEIKCPKCGQTFSDQTEFQNHLKEHHGMSGTQLTGTLPVDPDPIIERFKD